MNSSPSPDRIIEKARYVLGVDLGQANDPTAIAGIKHLTFSRVVKVSARRADDNWREIEARPSLFQVGYLERVPLGATYPGIVAHVSRLMARPIWEGNLTLAIDRTGVGRPVSDLFRSAGISFAGVTIVGGDTETQEGNDWRVPKITLISRLQALLHEGRLQIQRDLPEATTLVRELQDFRVHYTGAGNLTFGAREGKHDDLVLALAIAVWRANRPIHSVTFRPLIV